MKKQIQKAQSIIVKKYKKSINEKAVATHVRQFLFFFLVMMIGILLQILVVLNAKFVDAKKSYLLKSEKYAYWQEVASQFPNAPDILYNAALSSVQMGNKKQAVEYVRRALMIDPLFDKAKNLLEELSKR